MTTLFIKNMVCNRCITAVESIFNDFEIPIKSIKLGEVTLNVPLSDIVLSQIEEILELKGFERIIEASHLIIETIKNLIILKVSELDIEEDFLLSDFLTTSLHKDYSAMSKLFSAQENHTLEHYFILQKIEKVKELLIYNELTLTEIAGKLGYKSVQHLSAQFKNNTGFTPTYFKTLKDHNRKSLDLI